MPTRNGGFNKNKELYIKYFTILRDLCNDDRGWYDLFDESARGIFRKKIKISDGKLVTRLKGKNIEIQLNDDPAEVLQRCKDLYRKIGVKTDIELESEKRKYQERNKKGWSSIRRLGDQQFHIDNYIDRIAAIKRLKSDEIIDFRHNIYMGILSGRITCKHIEFQNNKIVSIAQ